MSVFPREMALLTAGRNFLLFCFARAVPPPLPLCVRVRVCGRVFDHFPCAVCAPSLLRCRARPRAIHRPEFLPAGRGSFNVITCGERSERLSMYDAANGATISRGVIGDEVSVLWRFTASTTTHHHHHHLASFAESSFFWSENCALRGRVRFIVPVVVVPKRPRSPPSLVIFVEASAKAVRRVCCRQGVAAYRRGRGSGRRREVWEGGYRLIVFLRDFTRVVAKHVVARATQPSLVGAFCSHGRFAGLVDETVPYCRLSCILSLIQPNTVQPIPTRTRNFIILFVLNRRPPLSS